MIPFFYVLKYFFAVIEIGIPIQTISISMATVVFTKVKCLGPIWLIGITSKFVIAHAITPINMALTNQCSFFKGVNAL